MESERHRYEARIEAVRSEHSAQLSRLEERIRAADDLKRRVGQDHSAPLSTPQNARVTRLAELSPFVSGGGGPPGPPPGSTTVYVLDTEDDSGREFSLRTGSFTAPVAEKVPAIRIGTPTPSLGIRSPTLSLIEQLMPGVPPGLYEVPTSGGYTVTRSF